MSRLPWERWERLIKLNCLNYRENLTSAFVELHFPACPAICSEDGGEGPARYLSVPRVRAWSWGAVMSAWGGAVQEERGRGVGAGGGGSGLQ